MSFSNLSKQGEEVDAVEDGTLFLLDGSNGEKDASRDVMDVDALMVETPAFIPPTMDPSRFNPTTSCCPVFPTGKSLGLENLVKKTISKESTVKRMRVEGSFSL